MNSRDYIDIVINQTSFNESLDISVDNIFIYGKPAEKPKPKSFRNYLTNEQKQFIIDNFTNTSDLKLTTNTEI